MYHKYQRVILKEYNEMEKKEEKNYDRKIKRKVCVF